MKIQTCIIVVLFAIQGVLLSAQGKTELSGYICDKESGEPLYMANVFIKNTTIGTTSNKNGYFKLENVINGRYEIIFSYLGYETETMLLIIEGDENAEVKIELKEKDLLMEEVVVEAMSPEEWLKYIEIFKRELLSTTDNSEECTVKNPEIINLKINKLGQLIASADEFLVIQNQALGYEIKLLIEKFIYDIKKDATRYMISPLYTEMIPEDEDEQEDWEENRRIAYLGSRTHFLKSLAEFRLMEEGFRISPVNSNSKSWWGRKGRLVEKLLKRNRSPNYSNDYAHSIVAYEGRGVRSISLDSHYMRIVYLDEPEERNYVRDYKRERNRKEENWQTTWIELPNDKYYFHKNGTSEELDNHIKQFGYWAWQRLADMVPFDYQLNREVE